MVTNQLKLVMPGTGRQRVQLKLDSILHTVGACIGFEINETEWFYILDFMWFTFIPVVVIDLLKPRVIFLCWGNGWQVSQAKYTVLRG